MQQIFVAGIIDKNFDEIDELHINICMCTYTL